MRIFQSLLLLLLALTVLNACKKGCTNVKALNYKQAAKSEDGTCEFCDTNVYLSNYFSNIVYDYNSTSPRYYENVGQLVVYNYYATGTGNACVKYGYNNSYVHQKYSFYNNTSQIMNFSFRINITDGWGNSYVDVASKQVNPYSSIDLKEMTFLHTTSSQPYVTISDMIATYQ